MDKELSKQKKAEFKQNGKPTANFIPIVVFGKIAESCANFLAKGIMTAVHGSIQTRTYPKQDGSKGYVTEVLASKVKFIDRGDNKPSSQTKPDSAKDFTGYETDDIFQMTDEQAPWE